MKKKIIWNGIMVAAILAIVGSGVMIVASVQGWFDVKTPTAATVKGEISSGEKADVENPIAIRVHDKLGGANIQRDGIAYALKDGTLLRDGDILETLNESEISLSFGDNRLRLGSNTEITIFIDADAGPSMKISRGETFLSLVNALALKLPNADFVAENAVFAVSVPVGSENIAVYDGTVTVGAAKAVAGQRLCVLENEVITDTLSIASLNDFQLQNIRATNAVKPLFFTTEKVDELTAARKKEKTDALKALTLVKKEKAAKEATLTEERENNRTNLEAATEQKDEQKDDKNTIVEDIPGKVPGPTAPPPEVKPVTECTVEIRCDTILENMGDLDEGKDQYVPGNGAILETSAVEFTEGETVFDVLQRVCDLAGIQLEYSFTPLYNSYYIEGINNLYEFDCGNESGWVYLVNGWAPNYGCSAYQLKNGDTISWRYTCKGFGTDAGGNIR